jgi:hypothetical protein
MDYTQAAGIVKPSWTHPGLLTQAWLLAVIAGLMDAGTPDGNGNVTYTLKASGCVPTATDYLSLVMRNELATSKDHRLTGAIAKSIKISSSESAQAVKMDTEFVANAVNFAYDGSSGTYTLPGDNILLHKGMVCGLVGVSMLQCPEYDFTIDFGLQSIVDNAAAPQEEVLGKFNIKGTVRFPWLSDDVIGDFIASTTNTLYFTWGTTGVSGYTSFVIPVKYREEPDQDMDNDVRLRQVISFEMSQQSGQVFQLIAKP